MRFEYQDPNSQITTITISNDLGQIELVHPKNRTCLVGRHYLEKLDNVRVSSHNNSTIISGMSCNHKPPTSFNYESYGYVDQEVQSAILSHSHPLEWILKKIHSNKGNLSDELFDRIMNDVKTKVKALLADKKENEENFCGIVEQIRLTNKVNAEFTGIKNQSDVGKFAGGIVAFLLHESSSRSTYRGDEKITYPIEALGQKIQFGIVSSNRKVWCDPKMNEDGQWTDVMNETYSMSPFLTPSNTSYELWMLCDTFISIGKPLFRLATFPELEFLAQALELNQTRLNSTTKEEAIKIIKREIEKEKVKVSSSGQMLFSSDPVRIPLKPPETDQKWAATA